MLRVRSPSCGTSQTSPALGYTSLPYSPRPEPPTETPLSSTLPDGRVSTGQENVLQGRPRHGSRLLLESAAPGWDALRLPTPHHPARCRPMGPSASLRCPCLRPSWPVPTVSSVVAPFHLHSLLRTSCIGHQAHLSIPTWRRAILHQSYGVRMLLFGAPLPITKSRDYECLPRQPKAAFPFALLSRRSWLR